MGQTASQGENLTGDWVLCAESSLLLEYEQRAACNTERGKKPLQKAAPHHPVLFSISVLPSSQSSILIILSEPSAHSKGRRSQSKEVLVAPLKGKSCRPCPGQRSASDPAEKKPHTGSCIQGTVVCSEEGNKGHCISLHLNTAQAKLFFFPPHSKDQLLPTGQRKGATSWPDTI